MEDCSHEVQFNGLCALCGTILTHDEEESANICMSHDKLGVTVSRKEAERLDEENIAQLTKSKKLSLIVDLDQTVVHAAWDPTVGEWLNDEHNINHKAMENIHQFVLPGSSRVYYIKLRPGLSEFLAEISKLYDMHIYTMGTRHYAEAVVQKIDPEGKFFGERIISRNENGSAIHKNLERLFPCDQSMVVILDDRADVWNFSPNLIKIKPYEFFVGIGDINSPFAPKKEFETVPQLVAVPQKTPILPPTKPATEKPVLSAKDKDSATILKEEIDTEKMTKNKTTPQDTKFAQSPPPPSTEGAAPETLPTSAALPPVDGQVLSDEQEQKQLVEGQKMQEQEDKKEDTKSEEESEEEESVQGPSLEEQERVQDAMAQEQQELRPLAQKQNELSSKTDKPLLVDDDKELYRMTEILKRIHRDFYTTKDSSDKKIDVVEIIQNIRKKVLKDVNIVFSGLIPLQQHPTHFWMWQLAEMFGAICSFDLTGRVTHLVAAKDGTSKVHMARRASKPPYIVTSDWLIDSTVHWKLQDESKYALPMSGPMHETEGEIENPESTPLDLEDDTFEDPKLKFVKDVDWDEADKEVDECLDDDETDKSYVSETDMQPNDRGGTEGEEDDGDNKSTNADTEDDQWKDFEDEIANELMDELDDLDNLDNSQSYQSGADEDSDLDFDKDDASRKRPRVSDDESGMDQDDLDISEDQRPSKSSRV
ncbi:uncharacterized protein BYT42DRAFT_617436 [Radiomyces spectabilis]|uniref:uncharacterized protein n=1 Tax=Radiomyces spectabilis TaxID=64574 RepID=UPI00221F12EF|nr:uncharacterized protein BYT42DRAFT_617436 [Radiomyces spectabilis]KAI8369405.1 hypothetical protein BYT42DRAFT_617436 [Radiomyces spectabilis]